MNQTIKCKDIISNQDNYKIFGRLVRLWDAKYVTTNSLISIDNLLSVMMMYLFVIPNFKDKIRYTPYVVLEVKSHI